MIVVAGPRTDLLEQEVADPRGVPLQEDGQAARHARPVRRSQAAVTDAKAHGSVERVGHRRHRIGRRRSERTDAGGNGASGCAALSVSRHHAELRPDHDVPAGSRDRAGKRRAPGSHGTIVRPDGAAQLGERRTWRRSRIPSKLASEPEKGDVAGPVSIAVATAVPAASPEKPDATPASNPRRGGSRRRSLKRESPRSATPTSPPTPTSGSKATAICS